MVMIFPNLKQKAQSREDPHKKKVGFIGNPNIPKLCQLTHLDTMVLDSKNLSITTKRSSMAKTTVAEES